MHYVYVTTRPFFFERRYLPSVREVRGDGGEGVDGSGGVMAAARFIEIE